MFQQDSPTQKSVRAAGSRGVAVSVLLALQAISGAVLAADQELPGLQDMAVEYYVAKYRVSADEARARVELQDRAAGIEDRLMAILGDQFAGIWFDHADRGRFKVGLPPGQESRQAEAAVVLRELGIDAGTDFVAVRFTKAELDRLQDALRDSLADMVARGQARTSQNPRLNNVVVTAPRVLQPIEESRIVELSRVAGVTVRRVDAESLVGRAQACNITYCDPPLRGARYMNGAYDSCTMAFTARHRVNTSHLLMITAGHCIWAGSPYFWAQKEAGYWTGAGSQYGYVLGGSGGLDAGVIRIDTYPSWVPPAPLAALIVKSYNGPNYTTTYDPEYEIKTDSLSTLGQLLCMSGGGTGTRCAEVSDLNADQVLETKFGTNFNLKHTGELDTCHTEVRDSGAPIYKKHKAYGIHLGKVDSIGHCYTFYQGIRGAENALNVDILLDDGD